MLTANEAKALADEAVRVKNRKPIEQAYKQIEGMAKTGANSTTLCFDPFRVNRGNKQNSEQLNAFLLELQGGGFKTDVVRDENGNKSVMVSW